VVKYRVVLPHDEDGVWATYISLGTEYSIESCNRGEFGRLRGVSVVLVKLNTAKTTAESSLDRWQRTND
jgi:hypothetical protein